MSIARQLKLALVFCVVTAATACETTTLSSGRRALLRTSNGTSRASSVLGYHCATPSPSKVQQLLVQRHLARAQESLSRANRVLPITVNVTFTVYTTVAAPKQNTSNVPDAIIKAQMKVLNAHYASSGFVFALAGIKRDTRGECETLNLDAFSGVGIPVYEQQFAVLATRQLAYGCLVANKAEPYSAAVLDIYLKEPVGTRSAVGQSSFPWDYKGQDIVRLYSKLSEGNKDTSPNLPLDGHGPVFDGIILSWQTLPGAHTAHKGPGYQASQDWNTGLSLVHEVGHWLALYHPFEGGCSGSGDWVLDTPPQAAADYGCGEVVSCGNNTHNVVWEGRLGYSDIQDNLMSLAPESCKKTFTPDQISRMLLGWVAYRDSASVPVVAPAPPNCSAVLTFDSIQTASTGAGTNISTAFNGLEWPNWTVVNASAAAAAGHQPSSASSAPPSGPSTNNNTLPATGYTAGMVSGPNVITNAEGAAAAISLGPAATSFNLSSFYATPVYVDTLNLTLTGTTGSSATLTASFYIVNSNRTLVQLSSMWRNLTHVTFMAQRNGEPQVLSAAQSNAVAIDNMCLSVTPAADAGVASAPGPAAPRSVAPAGSPPPPVSAAAPPGTFTTIVASAAGMAATALLLLA